MSARISLQDMFWLILVDILRRVHYVGFVMERLIFIFVLSASIFIYPLVCLMKGKPVTKADQERRILAVLSARMGN